MLDKKVRLGKGLEALIPRTSLISGKSVINIPVSEIQVNPYQPRDTFNEEEIQSLAHSIKENGVLQPVLVRKKGDHYELIAGERRFRASLLAQREAVPAIVKNVSDKESLLLALTENLERQDLNAIEEAKGFNRLIEEFSLTHQMVADLYGRSRSAITNTMRLLKLPQEIQNALIEKTITEGHARSLLAIDNNIDQMEQYRKVVETGLTVRQVETAVQQHAENQAESQVDTQPALFPDIAKNLSLKYSAKIKFKGSSQKGKIIFSYSSAKQLATILNKLSGASQ